MGPSVFLPWLRLPVKTKLSAAQAQWKLGSKVSTLQGIKAIGSNEVTVFR